ncbi:MAG: hypothetical protein KAT32_01615 [Candidatus Moranbacteria bacterium]|nr:hypothetical protein [Candidatus Moranbacteria bacterium]
MCEETKCPHCGNSCGTPLEEEKKGGEEQQSEGQDQQKIQTSSREEFNLAILLALVPAMTMSLFNLMGLM